MPTNYLRRRAPPPGGLAIPAGVAPGRVLIRLGDVALAVDLCDTPSARVLWQSLPLFGFAAPWGDCWHWEVPLAFGREPGARADGRTGAVYLWAEDARLLLPYGETPLSRPGEVRLPLPCNLLGHIIGAVDGLRRVRTGDKVSVERAPDRVGHEQRS
ncbi:MAG: cyclophilin-like family protein [Hyphomicrobiaceae bacterium]|nr:cyclophilin-like family protein [Hyphomicrobiaceae bacterium]